jgi:hypothetical protein
MKNFEQLTQEEQMFAVEEMVDTIVLSTLDGMIPDCFLKFQDEVDDVFVEEQSDNEDEMEDAIRETIEANKEMKLAMLHQAGAMAKRAIYLEDGDITVRLS